MTDPLPRLIEALQQAGCRPKRMTDGSWRAHSPLREDRRPSLGITERGDRILMNDFGGGRTRDVLECLGLRMDDLFRTTAVPAATSNPRRRRVAVYPYEDGDGILLAAKSRFEPKGFQWRHPSEETQRRWTAAWKTARADIVADIGKARPGAWTLGRGGITVSLYRLPDLVDQHRVIVANGEKAVDRLFATGFSATCAPSGENAWPDAYSEALWRANVQEVVVLPDNDKVGREQGLRIARSCHGYRPASLLPVSPAEPWGSWPNAELDDREVAPLRVRVLQLNGLPHHGDVVDWLDAGHNAAELGRLMDTAPDLDAVDQARLQRKREQNRDRQRRYRDRQRAAKQGRRSIA